MKKYFFFLHILLIFLFAGCKNIPSNLSVAEELLKTKPDSALKLLQNIHPESLKNESNKALYGLLLYKAFEKNNEIINSDSLINFSMNYYDKENEEHELAICYYYKARFLRKSQQFDNATSYYIVALDILKQSDDFYYIAKIYSDLGDICSIQNNYNESLLKYQMALNYFQIANDSTQVSYTHVNIGRVNRFLKNSNEALKNYRKAIYETKDSMLYGSALQEIGINYFDTKEFDSAEFYLKKSLNFPFVGTNNAIRCSFLGDVYYEKCLYDSAVYYTKQALKYPTTYFLQRECYRILVNTEYMRGNVEVMGKYLLKYQEYVDSIHTLESQTKAIVLEDLHNKTDEACKAKKDLIINTSILILLVLIISYLAYFYYKSTLLKKDKIQKITDKLHSKQAFLSQHLTKGLSEAKLMHTNLRIKVSEKERSILDKKIYEKKLHLYNWEAFESEMNKAFNNIISLLQEKYPTLTKREMTWCCLQLLEVPNKDRIMLLNSTQEAIYKMKQRIAKKMNLKQTKDLDLFLLDLTSKNI
ncbi:MAG: tetratricopeptide repeat protein [Paludibacter sp.]|nr:tetratricopeptide repeat protein [Paludibacter sp.]